jgi:hypothetical protein
MERAKLCLVSERGIHGGIMGRAISSEGANMDDDDNLEELEAEAWAEFQASLDQYMAEWSGQLAEAIKKTAPGEPVIISTEGA